LRIAGTEPSDSDRLKRKVRNGASTWILSFIR